MLWCMQINYYNAILWFGFNDSDLRQRKGFYA